MHTLHGHLFGVQYTLCTPYGHIHHTILYRNSVNSGGLFCGDHLWTQCIWPKFRQPHATQSVGAKSYGLKNAWAHCCSLCNSWSRTSWQGRDAALSLWCWAQHLEWSVSHSTPLLSSPLDSNNSSSSTRLNSTRHDTTCSQVSTLVRGTVTKREVGYKDWGVGWGDQPPNLPWETRPMWFPWTLAQGWWQNLTQDILA